MRRQFHFLSPSLQKPEVCEFQRRVLSSTSKMEIRGEVAPPVGSRHLDLKKSFKLALRSLLTACSKEEFSNVFSKFTSAEQEFLHRLFIKVIASLHAIIEDEFESLCIETQVGFTLDTVEQLVEEQGLDPLFSKKSNIMDTAEQLSTAKRSEIQYLTNMMEMAEEQNRLLRARVEVLKKEIQDQTVMSNVAVKLRNRSVSYGTSGSRGN